MSEVGVKLVSDLRLLTSAMDDFNILNDFKVFNDLPNRFLTNWHYAVSALL